MHSRRQFLKNSMQTYIGATLYSLSTLVSCGPNNSKSNNNLRELIEDISSLSPLPNNPNIRIAPGVEAKLISAAGNIMSDGKEVPNYPDGMGCFDQSGKIVLIRNHELAPKFGENQAPLLSYDPLTPGGTTTVILDDKLNIISEFLSLSGTSVNCAGGATPWNSWISCEETTDTPSNSSLVSQKHGYAFEVFASETSLIKKEPLIAMGRFKREAITIEPVSGIAYQTEDTDNSCLYRFIPDTPGDLTSGLLQVLKVHGVENFKSYTLSSDDIHIKFNIEWIDIINPDPSNGLNNHARSLGAAIFRRNEGIIAENNAIYFAATEGGTNKSGQIFKVSTDTNTLELSLACSENNQILMPDNLNINKYGDLIVCEDAPNPNYLLGIKPDGTIYPIARSMTGEWAGACFSPDGNILFVNAQKANNGETYALQLDWNILRSN
ncbi:alkaline phosphatase PhoX [Halobacteriovorax sp.]|uniref:alkaline phosphatase PhoX n=1 Tax=Halobacteriovorax sp. TaxID=2020862 RepID=UPI003AF22E86